MEITKTPWCNGKKWHQLQRKVTQWIRLGRLLLKPYIKMDDIMTSLQT